MELRSSKALGILRHRQEGRTIIQCLYWSLYGILLDLLVRALFLNVYGAKLRLRYLPGLIANFGVQEELDDLFLIL